MLAMDSEAPIRSHMENISWRFGKAPDYTKANQLYLAGRTRNHATGSLEKTVENLVKTFEMEATHKTIPKEFGSVDPDKFRMVVNGSRTFTLDDFIQHGSYNLFMTGSTLYDSTAMTFVESHQAFQSAMPEGFAWEVLDLYSGPPRVVVTWRHWGRFTGPYNGTLPSREPVEFFGSTIVTVNQDMRIEKLEMFFDATDLMRVFTGGKCPLLHQPSSTVNSQQETKPQ